MYAASLSVIFGDYAKSLLDCSIRKSGLSQDSELLDS
jgi:hypothetical protein